MRSLCRPERINGITIPEYLRKRLAGTTFSANWQATYEHSKFCSASEIIESGTHAPPHGISRFAVTAAVDVASVSLGRF
jgi:hypothetical protein